MAEIDINKQYGVTAEEDTQLPFGMPGEVSTTEGYIGAEGKYIEETVYHDHLTSFVGWSQGVASNSRTGEITLKVGVDLAYRRVAQLVDEQPGRTFMFVVYMRRLDGTSVDEGYEPSQESPNLQRTAIPLETPVHRVNNHG